MPRRDNASQFRYAVLISREGKAWRGMWSTEGTTADRSTAPVNASTDANGAEHDTTQTTLPLLPTDHIVDDDNDDGGDVVFTDRQEQEANSWPSQTAAKFLSSQSRRNSERRMFKLNSTIYSGSITGND